ncbi:MULTISPECIES: OmpP1/FadL family transporter [Deefgea]|uniref:Transporter n=1 Tax=Deefgea chitinilytica TaxID=570276 RepID=A0ABS2C8J1_9NEIS|nr:MULTISPECIES: outer membrane protein transport protein [Deefgea]MBM5570461.1 transporter [Deefgea chitinilytica]MBM9887690.1 outer membrane protein transport protein [Deefgea sp. CFH1-16]
MKQLVRSLKVIGAGSLMLGSASVMASGYHFGTQSASNQGVANSGAAEVMDASTIFYNPAGLSRLEGAQVSGVLNVIMPDGEYTNIKSTTATGKTITGGNGGNFGVTTAVPHMYGSYQINDKMTVGVGLFVPFGSHTDYENDWVGRYQTLESEIKTINLNPSISYKVNDTVALGAGLSAQYIEGTLSKALDLGAAANSALSGNKAYDGKSEVKGDDIGYGYNFGALFTISDATRVGLAYRSKIRHTLEGDLKFTVPAALQPTAIGRSLKNTSAKLNVETPESFSINGFHQFTPEWAMTADYTWTGHSRFDEIRIQATGRTDTVTVTNWRDTNRYSVGAIYTPNASWVFRAGLAYDQSPESNEAERIASIPDSDRIWYALGARYNINKNNSIDLAAIYVQLKDSTINRKPLDASEKAAGTINGNYSVDSITLGMQYNHRF